MVIFQKKFQTAAKYAPVRAPFWRSEATTGTGDPPSSARSPSCRNRGSARRAAGPPCAARKQARRAPRRDSNGRPWRNGKPQRRRAVEVLSSASGCRTLPWRCCRGGGDGSCCFFLWASPMVFRVQQLIVVILERLKMHCMVWSKGLCSLSCYSQVNKPFCLFVFLSKIPYFYEFYLFPSFSSLSLTCLMICFVPL